MNRELIDSLRLDAGIARYGDWDKSLVCVNKQGRAIDPIDGLCIFAELIMLECIDAVIEGETSSKMVLSPERQQIIEDIKERLGYHEPN